MIPFRLKRSQLLMLGCAYALVQPALASNSTIEEIEVLGEQQTQGLNLDKPSSTASRLGTNLQDIPASVSVVTKENIAIKGDYSGISAVTRSTGFTANASPGNGGTGSIVRGFGGHGSVMSMYDGNRMFVAAGTISFPQDTWTIDRIEVLRGPGSVVNGIGAIGATVNYIPKKPHFGDIESELSVTLGSHDLRRYALGSGGQINEKAAYRLDVVDHKSNGYVKGAKEERTAISNAYLVKAHDDVDILFSLDYAITDNTRQYYGTPLVNGKVASGTRKNNYNAPNGYVKYEDVWPRVQLNWRINDNVTFNSNVNYLRTDRKWSNIENYKYDEATKQVSIGSELYIRHDIQQLGTQNDVSLDFQLSDTISNKTNIGIEANRLLLSYDDSWANSHFPDGTSYNPNVNLHKPVVDNWYPNKWRDYDTTTMQYALFLDNVINFNDMFQLVTGIRRDVIDFERKTKANSSRQASSYTGKVYTTSWRAGLVYKPIESLSLYTQYSKAIDVTGSIMNMAEAQLKDKPMDGEQIEIGLKQQLINNTLSYTVSLFEISKKNIPSTDPLDTTRKIQIGKQISKGAELEISWSPIAQLQFDFNTAITKAEYKKFQDRGNNYKGKRPANIPSKTANLWATWKIIDPVSLGIGARYVGSRYYTNENTNELPAYTVYDANLSWQATEQLSLALRGKNLSNTKKYVLSGNQNKWILADGRHGEITLNYKF